MNKTRTSLTAPSPTAGRPIASGSAPMRNLGILANSRHEAFAHGIARGLPARTAFIEAGYRAHDSNASRLSANDKVVRRVVELKNLVQKMRIRSAQKVVLNEQWVLEQLIGVVLDARAQDRPDSAGANKALNLIGLHLGMFVEKTEIGRPGDFDGMSIADKRERIMDVARQLGLGTVSGRETVIGISRAKLQRLIDDGKSE